MIISCSENSEIDDTSLVTRCPTCPTDVIDPPPQFEFTFDEITSILNAQQIEQRLQTAACLQDALQDEELALTCVGQDEIENYILTIPSYPNCAFQVAVRRITCFSEILFSDFVLMSSDCNDWLDDLNAATVMGDLEVFIDDWQSEIYDAIFAENYDLFVQGAGGTNCRYDLQGNLLTNGGNFRVSIYSSSCNRLCNGVGNDGRATFERLLCGDACCLRRKYFCVDPESEEIVELPVSVTPLTVGCGETIIRTCTDPTSQISPCLNTCND